MIISCSNGHKPRAMEPRHKVMPDGELKDSLFCPKCFRSVPLTDELNEQIDRIKDKELRDNIDVVSKGGEE